MPPITSQSQAGDRAGCYGCRKREAPDTRVHGHGPAKVRQVFFERKQVGWETIEMTHIRYLTGTTVGTVGTTQAPTTLPTTHR